MLRGPQPLVSVQQHMKARAVQEFEFAQVDHHALGAASLRAVKMPPERRRRREIELTAQHQGQCLSVPGRLYRQLAGHGVKPQLAGGSEISA